MESTTYVPINVSEQVDAGQSADAAFANRKVLGKDELKAFHKKSDLRGLFELFFAWGSIGGDFRRDGDLAQPADDPGRHRLVRRAADGAGGLDA